MNLNTILRKAWQMLWHYRALWLFGAILSLVGASTVYLGPWFDWEDNDQWIRIKLSNTTTLQLPGADMTIDLTAPEGIRIITEDGTSWNEFRELVDQVNRQASINLWAITIEVAVILACLLLLGVISRYVVETAMIRMVGEAEENGKHLGLWQGLRRGFSLRAWRLFLIDFVVSAVTILVFIVVFGVVVAPVLLAIRSNEAIIIASGIGAFGLFIMAGYLWLAASGILSLVIQPIKRACALDNQGMVAAFRHGITLTKRHLKDVGMLWLVWMCIRLLWVPLGILIVILLVPFFLLTTLAGLAMGGLPATLVATVTSLFMGGATPWIMGALVGVPIFIVVMASPMLFVNGLVEVYMSSIWTLAYRDLRALESPAQSPVTQVPLVATPSSAD